MSEIQNRRFLNEVSTFQPEGYEQQSLVAAAELQIPHAATLLPVPFAGSSEKLQSAAHPSLSTGELPMIRAANALHCGNLTLTCSSFSRAVVAKRRVNICDSVWAANRLPYGPEYRP